MIASLIALLAFGSGAPNSIAQSSGETASSASDRFTYARSPGSLVLRYSEQEGELGEAGAETVEIYGDGHVVVTFSRYRRNPGPHEMRLSVAELSELMASVVQRGLVEFDSESIRERRASAASARRRSKDTVLFNVSDESTLTIDLNLETYRRRGQAVGEARPIKKRIRYRGLRGHVRSHPEITELGDLLKTQQQLRSIMGRAAK